MADSKNVPPVAPIGPPMTTRPLDPARHIAPAAHSEVAAHAAQAAGIEAAAIAAATTEEVGREAMARIQGADPLLAPDAVTPVMPDAPRRRRKRTRRATTRKKKK